MDTLKLGHTDLQVSRICFGTMTFGSQMDEATAHRTLDYCVDQGINFIDTANVYNRGESERITGKWLAANRSKVVLATKVRGKMGDGPDEQGLSKAAIVKALKSSLAETTKLLKEAPASPGATSTGLWVAFIEHSGEHYGQMVVYYRLNGSVPQASRPGH